METESWFEDYAEEMYKYILFMVKDRGTAEDLTQDTFIKAFVHSREFKGDSAVRTWLYRIAYTTTMNHFRKKHPVSTLFDSPINMKSAESAFLEQDNLKELYRTISTLKMSHQKVIILRKIQMLSVKETAEVLGWSESKVKMQLSRALVSLKDSMKKQGGVNYEQSTR
ncbi:MULTISPECIES: RNA polymerase sigma factor [unclassified Exiguobacterium]|uniref:RNA polymerase sigma factor n=1 Tax=unclassified Exiguobacterium TaxID=2644629 RepID=UPI001BEC50AA|nr:MULTISPECIES: sigma-70 family RNA polymerase sigma factor [unclassified Exiguobacterium]